MLYKLISEKGLKIFFANGNYDQSEIVLILSNGKKAEACAEISFQALRVLFLFPYKRN